MLKRRFKKITAMALLALFMLSPVAYAGNIRPNAETGNPGVAANDVQGLVDFMGRLLKYFSAIGGVIVVGAFMYNGYKLTSPDPRTRADAMQGFMYVILGGIISFGAFYFAGVLKGIADTL